jgi:hypothetical protein
MSLRSLCPSAAAAIALATCLVTHHAAASDRLALSVDWGKLGDFLRGGTLFPAQESWRPASLEQKPASSSVDLPWLGSSTHVSLVARDWSGAQLLMGHLMLTDELRLSRSCRMVLTRLRLVDGRFTPFFQAGIGQWRVDTDLMPFLPRDVELAGQTGGGFELAVGSVATIALEADYTILYREQHEPQMVSEPRPWVAFVAARARF